MTAADLARNVQSAPVMVRPRSPHLTRRAFTQLSIAAFAGLCGLSVASPARADEKLEFEIFADKASEFRWRLKAANGQTLATSGQGYKAKADAKHGIDRIKQDADKLTFDVYEDAKHEYRWRLKAKNGQIIGASSEGYKAKADADHAVTLVKDGAKDATVSDTTKSGE